MGMDFRGQVWSEIGSGFGEPGGTPPPRILRSTPPPKEKPLVSRGGYQNCRLMLTVKKFHGISNLTISGNFHRLLAAEETPNGKTSSRIVKNTLSRHSKTLQLVYI